ncbi:hypothetical protein SFR_4177 [Streptomyces sp. FR-008]|nr:hypothetical protein SFR_4177 [Streptomyces sp. FR-008]
MPIHSRSRAAPPLVMTVDSPRDPGVPHRGGVHPIE